MSDHVAETHSIPKQRFRAIDEACREASRRFFVGVLRQSSPFLASIRTRSVPEGMALSQEAAGHTDTVEMQEVSSLVSVPGRVIRETDVDGFAAALKRAAEDMVAKQTAMLLQTLDRVVTEGGRVYDAGGRLDFDTFLSVVERTALDFSEGRPNLQILCSPETGKRIGALQAEWVLDPRNRRRYDDLMWRKYREWRDRESARKLVD